MIKTKFGGEQDILYYDIEVFNNTESGIETDFPLSFTETRPVQFIERCAEYELSVVRFNLGLSNLPVFIPKIKSNQASRDATIYNLIIYSGGASTLVNVPWTTQEIVPVLPAQPVVDQEFSPYYFCYSYQHFLNIINNAIAGVLGANIAWFQLNQSTNNVELISTATLYGAGPAIIIGMNDPLKNLFSTFSFKKVATAFAYSEPYYYNIEMPSNAVVYGAFYICSTFTCPLSLWNPVSSIVFTSSVIPVIPDAVGPEKFFSTDRVKPNQSNANNTLNIITDFQVDIGPNSYYRPNIAYEPTAEYRLISLFGNSGLNQVQINIYWKDNYGGLHLINLGNNCIGTIKLMFRKKNNLD